MSRPSAAPRRVLLVQHLSRIIFLLSSSATTGGRNRNVSTILLTEATTSPVSKIVDTLRNLQKSASEEQTADGNNYRAVFNWCQETFSDRQTGHKQYLSIENELGAKLKVNTAVNRQLKDEVATLQNEMGEAETAIKQGSVLRQSEHEDYLREQKDAATMLGELNRASGALSPGSSGLAGNNKVSKALLLQVAQNVQALAARSSAGGGGQLYQSRTGELVSKLQDQDSTDYGWAKNSDLGTTNEEQLDARSVLEVLRELKTQFEQSLRSAESQERKALEEYDSLIRMKKDVLFQLQTSKDAKDAMLAESEQAKQQETESEALIQFGDDQHNQRRSAPPQSESQSTQNQSAQLLQSSKELTFSSVKKMVAEMITQINAATENEAEHKNWCENELSKNAAALNEKNTKLRRISTKTDNEKQALAELEMNLKTLSSETDKLNREVMHFRELRLQEKALFAKTSQNHQVASQILKSDSLPFSKEIRQEAEREGKGR
eukprot:g12086.t1